MTVINLTEHTINDLESEQNFVPSGTVSRVKADYTKVSESGGLTFYEVEYGEVKDLPEELDIGTIYVVSSMVLEAIKRQFPQIRGHFVAPGELIRDENGKPMGCRGFKIA